MINDGFELEAGNYRLYTSPALWIGVGANVALDHGNVLRPKESAIEKLISGEYTDPLYNDQLQHPIGSASGIPLMAVMLTELASEIGEFSGHGRRFGMRSES